jgi:hypothetical protein
MEANEIFALVMILLIIHVFLSMGIYAWIFKNVENTYAAVFLSCCPLINIIFAITFTIYKICKSFKPTIKSLK